MEGYHPPVQRGSEDLLLSKDDLKFSLSTVALVASLNWAKPNLVAGSMETAAED